MPPGYRVEERNNNALAIGGGVLFGAAYVASLVGAVSGDEPGQGWLAAPVVGPFAALLTQRVQCDDGELLSSMSSENCSTEVLDAARRSMLLLVDGLFQVTGATLLVVGLSTGETYLVRDVPVAVSARVEPTHYGVSVSGSF